MPSSSESATAVVRMELKRLDLAELVRQDDLLRGCPLLRHLSPAAVEPLLAAATVRRYVDNAFLFREGDEGQSLFLVLNGEVRLVKGPGGHAEFAVARKGDLLGEAGCVAQAAVRTLSALASGVTEVAELPVAAVRAAACRTPALAAHLQELHAGRSTAQAEMADFLNRW